MRCPEMMERLTDRLHGRLDGQSDRELTEHLAGCPACRAEAEQTEGLWRRLGGLEASEDVPSARMRSRLWAALSAYEERRSGLGGRLREAIERLWPREPAWQLAFTAAALVVGLLAGSRLTPNASGEIRALRGELHSMQQTISVSLLQHQSASERLRGVDLSTRVTTDDTVIAALLDTVRHDTNVNVRLAAIDALAPVVARPPVSRELLAMLEGQDSTLVRASVAEVLLRADVAGAAQAVNKFLAEEELEGPARDYLKALMRRGQA
jgi:putative zinc finger protein